MSIPDGVTVNIPRFHRGARGSIPRPGDITCRQTFCLPKAPWVLRITFSFEQLR